MTNQDTSRKLIDTTKRLLTDDTQPARLTVRQISPEAGVNLAMIKYRELTKLSIPYLIQNDEISLPLDILPYIKLHFGTRKSEADCKVIAFQMVYTMQLIFYRAEEFRKYCGIDICNEQQMQDFLDTQLNLFLGGIGDEK